MADLDDEDEESYVSDFVDVPVLADPKAAKTPEFVSEKRPAAGFRRVR